MPFMYLHMQVSAVFFFALQLIDRSLHLCEGVQYFQEDLLACLWPGTLGGMRAEASYGIKVLFPPAFDGFRCKCTVTLC